MNIKYLSAASLLILGACADHVAVNRTYDDYTGLTWTNVKSVDDAAGGPRQDVLVATDPYKRIVATFNASGPGTWQTVTYGLAGDLALAGGGAGAAALLRPSKINVGNGTTTTVSGGSVAPGAAVATASPRVTATGGAGGRGGTAVGGTGIGGTATAAGGSATATGGTATSSSNPTASFTNTSSPTQTNIMVPPDDILGVPIPGVTKG